MGPCVLARFAAYPRCSTDSEVGRGTDNRTPAVDNMSALVLVAASLAILLGVAHSYLGEQYILIRLFRRADLPILFGGQAFTRHTLRFAWHLTTVAWLGFAGLLFQLASPSGGGVRTQARVISITFMASGVVSLFGSRGRHLSWVVFFLIAGLTWLAFP